jgi:hypothetical protein
MAYRWEATLKGAISSPIKRLAAKTAFIVAVCSLLGSAVTTAHAATHQAASWPTTVSQAQTEWPGAELVKLGAVVHAGRYIFKDPSGHYGLLSVSTSVSALNATRQTGHPSALMSSSCVGCVYGVTANVSVSSFLWGSQWLNTYNGVKYGYYAWNISATPGCSGAGSCQTPITGTIGNYTSTVNPWDNQYINYWGCCSGVTYLRAYVTLWNGVSGWAVQDS